ncbi:MAG: hypothetical protein WC180_06510 [Candidatus Paceibacterota bacterium]
MTEEKPIQSHYALLWAKVKNELSKREMSANKVAVLEMEKIFKKALADKNLPGKNIEDQIKNYAGLFQDSDKLKYARAMHRKLINKSGFDISEEDTKEIVKGYREAILDLEKLDFSTFSLKEKTGLFLKRNFYSFPQKTKKILLTIMALSILTFILSETESGRSISASLINANNYFFYKIIPALLILAALIVIVIGALYAYQNKDK